MITAFDGLVLAAGRSMRMGRDKALLEVEGVPLWRRQRDTLRDAGAADVLVSARPEQSWAFSAGFAAVLHDALPDCGPLVGITAGLERSSRSHLAVLAIDLPHLPSAWLRSLLERCDSEVGCAGRRGECFEPLAAVYPRALMWLAWERLAAGQYGLQPLLAEAVAQGLMTVVEIGEPDAQAFANWNRPDEVR